MSQLPPSPAARPTVPEPAPSPRAGRRRRVARSALAAAVVSVGLAVVPGPVLRLVDDLAVQREPLSFRAVAAVQAGPTDGSAAQESAAESVPADSGTVESAVAVVEPFVTIGVALPAAGVAAVSEETPVEVRWRTDDRWSAWQELEVTEDHGPDPATPEAAAARHHRDEVLTQPLWVGDADAYQVRLPAAAADPATPADAAAPEVVVVRRDGKHLVADTSDVPAGAQSAGQPAIHTRGEWGARPASGSLSSASELKLAVVHHSATGNDYAPGDVPGIIRSIQAYHMDGNGWSDIGYNFVVDKYGGMWEGRGDSLTRNTVGAHAEGFNTGSVGVVALGNMTTGSPSSGQVDAIADIIAWKFANAGVDPSTTVSFTSGGSPRYPAGVVVDLPRVVGHRDVGLTDCPGANLYTQVVGRIRSVLPALVAAKSSPVGVVDVAAAGPRSLYVSGWALDPLNPGPIDVHVYVDGVGRNLGPTTIDRPDLAAGWPGGGIRHGFAATFDGIGPGDHQVCVFGINTGLGSNTVIGCRTVTVRSGPPTGVLDVAVGGPDGALTVSGWSIDPDTQSSNDVHLYVDGRGINLGPAANNRPDIGAALPGYGARHGFSWSTTGLAPGRHDVCAYGIDAAAPGPNALLGCRTAVVPGGPPIGIVDAVQTGPNGTLAVSGWAIDPDTAAPTAVHVYVDSAGYNTGSTRVDRPDLAAAFPGYGGVHGFAWVAGGFSPGLHRVCAYAIDTGGGAPAALGCRDVVVPGGPPIGVVDSVVAVGANRVAVSGWAVDLDTADPIDVHVYVDGAGYNTGRAAVVRPDIGAAFPAYGAGHGISWTSPALAPGTHQVCVFGINVGPGTNSLIDCRRVVV